MQASLGRVGINNFKILLASFLVGTVLLLTSALYVAPDFIPAFHGAWYGQMTQHPFDFAANAPFHFRILTPLIAYCLNVSIDNYVFVPLAFAQLLLAAIFFFYRKNMYSNADASAMASFIAFSSVIFITLITPGYTDIVSYFFIFLSFATVRNFILSVFFFTAALFNHEANLVLLPALCAYSYRENEMDKRSFVKYASALSLSLVAYLVFRYFAGHGIKSAYDAEAYLSLSNMMRNSRLVAKLTPMGAFFAFKLFWIIPIAYLWMACRSGFNKSMFVEILPVVLIVFGTGVQLLIAYDITRLFSLAFVAILLSAQGLKTMMPGHRLLPFALILIILNFFIPQYFISQEGANRMFPMWSVK